MMTADLLERRRQEIAASADLSALYARLADRARPVLDRTPAIPAVKAMLSADGGICPRDRAALVFDPWSPTAHRCPVCGGQYMGERHDRAWAHFQHLWLAERAAHLATLAAVGDHAEAAARAEWLLRQYAGRYLDYPNRDNVLGPARLFFSTYLESIWITNYLAAAVLLRGCGALSDDAVAGVSAVADEAANLIGEFDEGLSNRQTWHNAALAAIAVWFEDSELAAGVVERESGMIGHLLHGFGGDGMWYEGENYHLFALRGQLLGLSWARLAGTDLLADPELAAVVDAALRAPALTALPDGTFPARKDARFGVSLAQPMYLESWEVGLAALGRADAPLWGWVRDLYGSGAPAAQRFDSYLHEAGEPAPSRPRTRADLSWWALLEMAPSPPDAPAWTPSSVVLHDQGLAVLRHGTRYASLESGRYGGGHGHPDRLHLTVHAAGVHWLPDFGTGSYVARDLFWYRSTLAHNAPRLNGASQPVGDATCEYFDQAGDWGWVRGRFGTLTRTIVAGPDYLIDVLDLSSGDEQLLELPWHLAGHTEVLTPGSWTPDELASEFVSGVERFVPAAGTPAGEYVIRATAPGPDGAPATCTLRCLAVADLLRAEGPGAPGTTDPAAFYVLRAAGRNLRYITLVETAPTAGVRAVHVAGDTVEIETAAGVHSHAATIEGWDVATPAGAVPLRGRQEVAKSIVVPLFSSRYEPIEGVAVALAGPPALDGTLDGFADAAPLTLDYEDQYRRSEAPYPGPDEFAATAYVNWTEEALYVGVDIVKSDVTFRPAGAPPLCLDNDPEDIHSDGLQIYLRLADEAPVYGVLIVPDDEDGAIRARGIVGTDGEAAEVRGAWQRTDSGYCITVAITIPDWPQLRHGDRPRFDLLVNQMEPDRLRRAGQLVWSGGGGWIWLRGDRQDPARFGVLTLQ